MQIKHDVKGQLARLLATEDLIVEHRSVDTASFNVQTRVLTLPTWDNATEEVYDTLVCHEVGHALYTPDIEWWINNEISASIVNIVEDARIEKLMKRRYAGLSKTFFRGYSSLSEDNFFQLDGKDLTKFNLADRINLYYKVGNFVDIPFFNNEETFLMNRTGLTETFDDVLEVAKLIFEYCKAEAEKKRQEAEQMKQDTETEGSLDNNTMSGQSNSGEPSVSVSCFICSASCLCFSASALQYSKINLATSNTSSNVSVNPVRFIRNVSSLLKKGISTKLPTL